MTPRAEVFALVRRLRDVRLSDDLSQGAADMLEQLLAERDATLGAAALLQKKVEVPR